MRTCLIEFEVVQKIVQFSVLVSFIEPDIVLLQAMQGEFGLVIDEYFKWLQSRIQSRIN